MQQVQQALIISQHPICFSTNVSNMYARIGRSIHTSKYGIYKFSNFQPNHPNYTTTNADDTVDDRNDEKKKSEIKTTQSQPMKILLES